MVNPVEFVGGAGLGTVFSLLCEVIAELIRKNHMFSGALKEIQSKLECLSPLITQMSQSNLQLPYASVDELNNLHAVMKAGKDLVVKCGKLSQWRFLKRYKYANKLIAWEKKFESTSQVVRMQGLRDGKMTAVGVQTLEVSTGNIKVSTGKIEVSAAKIEVSVGNLMDEVKDVKISTRNIEVSVGNLTDEVKDVKILTEKIEVSVGILTEELKNIRVEVNQTIKENSAGFNAWSAVPELPPHPVGLDVPLKELKEKFLWEDGVSMFVVTAFGGCGKTTLVSKFCLDVQVKDKFNNNIFFVAISKNPKMDLIRS